MRKPPTVLTALLLGATLALTACGDDPATTDTSNGSASTPNEDAGEGDTRQFNDADVSFAQGMIPHHQQAVEMAQLAADRAENAEIKELAAQVEAAQAPEIEQLTNWLESWGENPPSAGTDHGEHGDMSGMMTEEDMTALEDASGAEFDKLFAKLMIEHHRGAVSMAETEVADGENADAIAMAEDIIATQNTEIEQMQTMLED